jgi:hypothetical protein
MKFLGRISVLLAETLLMFHTFVPHQHHIELNAKEHIVQHKSADSLFDFIKLALHLDQGEGHLEDYQLKNQQFNLAAVTLDVPIFAFDRIVDESSNVSFFITQDTLPERYIISNLRFRGPPA